MNDKQLREKIEQEGLAVSVTSMDQWNEVVTKLIWIGYQWSDHSTTLETDLFSRLRRSKGVGVPKDHSAIYYNIDSGEAPMYSFEQWKAMISQPPGSRTQKIEASVQRAKKQGCGCGVVYVENDEHKTFLGEHHPECERLDLKGSAWSKGA